MDFGGVGDGLQNGGDYEAKQDINVDSVDYKVKYDEIQHKCSELAMVIQNAFSNVSNVIQNETGNEQFLIILSQTLESAKINIEGVIKSDPNVFNPSKMQIELNQLRHQKEVGLQKMKELQDQLTSLNQQKTIWEAEKNKGKQIIQELQSQLESQKNNNNNNSNNINNNNIYNNSNGNINSYDNPDVCNIILYIVLFIYIDFRILSNGIIIN